MRKVLVGLLIFITVFTANPVRESESRANPIALAAPEVVGGMLLLLALACVAAERAGTLDHDTSERYQASLHEKADAIQALVKRGLKVSVEAIESSLVLLMRIQAVVHSPYICEQLLRKRSGEDRRMTPRETPDRRVRSVSNCSNFEECCSDFRQRLGSSADYRHKALRVFKNAKHNKLQCCFEFDSVHKGLEIFDENGRHLGERGCDDDNPDPCAWTVARGSHAAPSPGDHVATRGKCAH